MVFLVGKHELYTFFNSVKQKKTTNQRNEMNDKEVTENLRRIVRGNDLNLLRPYKNAITQLLGSNNGFAVAIILGTAAVEGAVDFRDNDAKVLAWLVQEFRAIITNSNVGHRIAEFAWDIASFACMRVCLANGMFPHVYRHSRWMQNQHFAEFLKPKQDAATCLESYSLLINLVHTTFPLIPPVMSAFYSNSHMSQLLKMAKENPQNVFYGLHDEVRKIGLTEEETNICLKVLDSLLFLLSYLYTEVVVFDTMSPNWIAWNNVIKFSSSVWRQVS